MLAGFNAAYDCIKAFSETDFTEDLKKFDVPTLILQGDDDQIVPIGAAALLSSKLVKDAKLKSTRASRTACAPPKKTRSTPTSLRSSRRSEPEPRLAAFHAGVVYVTRSVAAIVDAER